MNRRAGYLLAAVFAGLLASVLLIQTSAAGRGVAAPRTPQAAAAADEFDYFVGSWHCAGTFSNGAAIESDLRFEKVLDGKWLLFHHDDRPPNRYHALAEWTHQDHRWTAAIQDSFGGLRLFHAGGWEGTKLTWEGGAAGDAAAANERFVYERADAGTFRLSYQVQKSGEWRTGDTLACSKVPGQ
jgi:hypothetical protein